MCKCYSRDTFYVISIIWSKSFTSNWIEVVYEIANSLQRNKINCNEAKTIHQLYVVIREKSNRMLIFHTKMEMHLMQKYSNFCWTEKLILCMCSERYVKNHWPSLFDRLHTIYKTTAVVNLSLDTLWQYSKLLFHIVQLVIWKFSEAPSIYTFRITISSSSSKAEIVELRLLTWSFAVKMCNATTAS